MRRLVLLALTFALVAGGCGAGGSSTEVSKDQYLKDLEQAGQTLQRTFSDILSQTGAATSPKQTGERLDRGATALDQAAARFAKIEPPSDAKGAHAKLVEGLRELADVFRQGAAAARRNDTASLTKVLQGLATSDGVKKITEAQQELAAKGITTPSGGAGTGSR